VMKVMPDSGESVLPEDPSDSKLYRYATETFQTENVNKLLLPLIKYLNSWVVQLVLIMFVLFFLLVEGRMLTQRVVEIFGPSPEVQSKVVEALAEMAKSIRAYLVWRTIVNFGLGLILALVFQAAGLRHAWTWGMLAAVLCYVPYAGTIVASVPPMIDAFVNVDPRAALGILLFYVVVVTVEGYLIVPVVMGRSMDLNATTVLLSCLFWDLVWGTPGLFLAMPLMAGIKAICMYVPGWRPLANLMGTTVSDPIPPPPKPVPSPSPDGNSTPEANGPPVVIAKSEANSSAR
jgi:AI-2 transport protein TqsA